MRNQAVCELGGPPQHSEASRAWKARHRDPAVCCSQTFPCVRRGSGAHRRRSQRSATGSRATRTGDEHGSPHSAPSPSISQPRSPQPLMSVATESPFRQKRALDRSDSSPDRHLGCGKRYRRSAQTPSSSEKARSSEAAHAVAATARAALMGLFPEISEQVSSGRGRCRGCLLCCTTALPESSSRPPLDRWSRTF